jgi:hypothetical protein
MPPIPAFLISVWLRKQEPFRMGLPERLSLFLFACEPFYAGYLFYKKNGG